MKAGKSHSRSIVRSTKRAVSIQIRDCKVTLKVKTPVPQVRTAPSLPVARWNQ